MKGTVHQTRVGNDLYLDGKLVIANAYADAPSDALDRAAKAAGFTLMDEDSMRVIAMGYQPDSDLASQALFSDRFIDVEHMPREVSSQYDWHRDAVSYTARDDAAPRRRAGMIALALFVVGVIAAAALSLYPHG